MTTDDVELATRIPVVDYNDPASVEQEIVRIHGFIHKGVKHIAAQSAEHKRLDRQRSQEYAVEFLAHIGPQTEKRQVAELATMDRRREVDEAKVLLDYSRDRMRELEKQMSGLQSILSDLRTLYNSERGRG